MQYQFYVKYYDITVEGGEEGVNGRIEYKNEINGYEFLRDITYRSINGKEMNIVPKIYEVGENFISMEKFDMTIFEAINKNKIKTFNELFRIVRNFIDPILIRLDEIGFRHYDIALRNFAINEEFTNVVIFDLSDSEIIKNHVNENWNVRFGTLLNLVFGAFGFSEFMKMNHTCKQIYKDYLKYDKIIRVLLHLGTQNFKNVKDFGYDEISENDNIILENMKINEISKDEFCNLKFSVIEIDTIELEKIWNKRFVY